MPKFPKTIHVTYERNANEAGYWLNIPESDGQVPSVDKETVVAVYQLVDVGSVEVTRTFVQPKKARRR